jgi:hypothetical protein
MSTKNIDEEIVKAAKIVQTDDYSSDDDDDNGDFEYREKMAIWLEKKRQQDDIEEEAMETYRDTWFFYNIFRPHISVWIKWYRECYLVKGTSYGEDDARRDIAFITKKMKK